MATTTTTFSVLALEDAALEKLDADTPADPENGRRAYVRVRADLGISSFGANAIYQAQAGTKVISEHNELCLLYTSPSPRDGLLSRMPSSA